MRMAPFLWSRHPGTGGPSALVFLGPDEADCRPSIPRWRAVDKTNILQFPNYNMDRSIPLVEELSVVCFMCPCSFKGPLLYHHVWVAFPSSFRNSPLWHHKWNCPPSCMLHRSACPVDCSNCLIYLADLSSILLCGLSRLWCHKQEILKPLEMADHSRLVV